MMPKKLLSILLMSAMFLALEAAEYVLVKDKTPQAEIVLPDTPSRAAQLGALELNEHIRMITGVELPIVSESQPGTAELKLYIGDTAMAHKSGLTQDALKSQESAVRFLPKAIVFVGKDKLDTTKVIYRAKNGNYAHHTWPGLYDERGSLNAVYQFLERFCGVRWFDTTEFGTHTPSSETMKVEGKDFNHIPAFRYRDVLTGTAEFYNKGVTPFSSKSKAYAAWEEMAYPTIFKKVNKRPEFGSLQRFEVMTFLLRKQAGGEYYKANHSFYGYYDRFWEKNPRRPNLFVEKHTDWFAQGYPLAKVPPQLCYSNPEVIKQVMTDARTYFTTDGKKEWGENNYSLCPMDNNSWCKCERCQSQLTNETPKIWANGIASNYIWGFVNTIAKELGKEFPGKTFSALAYSQYTSRPNFPLEPNIRPMLCLDLRNPVCSPEAEALYFEFLDAWSDLKPYLWLYYCFPRERVVRGWKEDSPHYFPGYCSRTIAKNFRIYKQKNVSGMFFNGFDLETDCYITFAMLQDPGQDVEALLKDYYTGMYGEAGKELLKFYNLVEKQHASPSSFAPGLPHQTIFWGRRGNEKAMAELKGYVDAAQKIMDAQGTEIQKKRFELFKFSIWDYMVEGRKRYVAGQSAVTTSPKYVVCPAASNEANGNLDEVNWAEARVLNDWNTRNAEGSTRKVKAAVLHDSTYFYVYLYEKDCLREPMAGDMLQVIADTPQADAASFFVKHDGSASEGVIGRSVWKDGVWNIYAAIPLKALKLDDRNRTSFNVFRRSAPTDDLSILDEPGWKITGGEYNAYPGKITMESKSQAVPKSPQAKPIADWDLNTLKDLSGNGNELKITPQVTKVESPLGPALHFPIFKQYTGQDISIPSLKGLEGSTEFSYLLWFKPVERWLNNPGTYGILLADEAGNRAGGYFLRHSAGVLWGTFPKTDGSGKHTVTTQDISEGKWNFVCVTLKDGNLRIYLNGRLAVSRNDVAFKNLGAEKLTIGDVSQKVHHMNQFRGDMAGIKFYNKALTEGEQRWFYLEGMTKLKNSSK